MKIIMVISTVKMMCPHTVNFQHMNLFVMNVPSKKLDVLASLMHVRRPHDFNLSLEVKTLLRI
jgi:hypothetical protein